MLARRWEYVGMVDLVKASAGIIVCSFKGEGRERIEVYVASIDV
jgi:hypothetical protein